MVFVVIVSPLSAPTKIQTIQCLRVKVKSKLLKMGAMNPMNIFLRQEVDRMQRIINVVRISLTELKLAIDGTIIMSEVRSIIFTKC